ncbi:hypothetical protein GGTG_01730 [Gaeumannomyces tritici R3-111a-1]|uniref:Uncharacterized protein n=1 Tax=Gaeumannomyces tritici (strain R3-111a-1) TaxID=644352 RepID=J3NKE8_GAET3|nr:hypothetical protein GGTG_01730 [Gaeumannomyces tritici R3-111a-1]EJT81755.1 hypothetical protein GGTG_01730 [Gaeumannomyces tritici R3-111a-1]
MRFNIVLVSFLMVVVFTYGLNAKASVRTHNGFEKLKCTNTGAFVNSNFNLQKAFFAIFPK